jgi:hypothetical protein
MNKTHVPYFPITGRQYLNYQVTLRFCAIRSAGQSVRSSARMSAGSSARTRNVVHFFPVTP